MATHVGPLTRRRPVDYFKSLPVLRDIKGLVFEDDLTDELSLVGLPPTPTLVQIHAELQRGRPALPLMVNCSRIIVAHEDGGTRVHLLCSFLIFFVCCYRPRKRKLSTYPPLPYHTSLTIPSSHLEVTFLQRTTFGAVLHVKSMTRHLSMTSMLKTW